MSNLIVQVNIPTGEKRNVMWGYHKTLYDHSVASGRIYANAVSAQHLVIENSSFPLHPTFERFQIFGEEFDEFDNILYIDCDVVIRGASPNVFTVCSKDSFYAFPELPSYFGNVEETQFLHETGRFHDTFKFAFENDYGSSIINELDRTWVENSYFNAGVFVVGKETRRAMRGSGIFSYIRECFLMDQTALNKFFFETKMPVDPLTYQFNCLLECYRSDLIILEEICRRSFFVHFNGRSKEQYADLLPAL